MSDASWYHHREAQNHSPEHSRSPFLAGGMISPPLSRMLDPCQSSSNNWKLISFNTTWLHPKLKKYLYLSLYLFLPLLACTYLYNSWDLLLGALPLSVCLFKMNRFMYSPIALDKSVYKMTKCKFKLWQNFHFWVNLKNILSCHHNDHTMSQQRPNQYRIH